MGYKDDPFVFQKALHSELIHINQGLRPLKPARVYLRTMFSTTLSWMADLSEYPILP